MEEKVQFPLHFYLFGMVLLIAHAIFAGVVMRKSHFCCKSAKHSLQNMSRKKILFGYGIIFFVIYLVV